MSLPLVPFQEVAAARPGQHRIGKPQDLVGGQVVQAIDLDLEVGLVVGSRIAYQVGRAAILEVFQLALADGQIDSAESKEGEVIVTANACIGIDAGKIDDVGGFPVPDPIASVQGRVGRAPEHESVIAIPAKKGVLP